MLIRGIALLSIIAFFYRKRYRLRTDKQIRRVNCRTYILHGTKDRLIPISHSEQLQKINPPKITHVRVEGGVHNNLPYQLSTIS